MTTIAKKLMVVGAVVLGMTLGTGGMDVSAGPQQANQLERGDSASSAVTVRHAPAMGTVHQGRYGIGFLPW
jgi:hypothetical protein